MFTLAFQEGFMYYWTGSTEVPEPFLASMLAFAFASAASAEERTSLTQHQSYLRFFLRQDGPDSVPYVVGMLRPLCDESIYSSHRDLIGKTPKEHCCMEINYRSSRSFFSVPSSVIACQIWSEDVDYLD